MDARKVGLKELKNIIRKTVEEMGLVPSPSTGPTGGSIPNGEENSFSSGDLVALVAPCSPVMVVNGVSRDGVHCVWFGSEEPGICEATLNPRTLVLKKKATRTKDPKVVPLAKRAPRAPTPVPASNPEPAAPSIPRGACGYDTEDKYNL